MEIPIKQNETPSSRRNWLKNMALLSAASMASPLMASSGIMTSPENISKEKMFKDQAIRLIVSTYSYWHFEKEKYPIEKVIENAARIGFDGVEILQRQFANHDISYFNKLKRMAFDNGLALPFLSIHQNFVEPDAKLRSLHIEHTFECIRQAVQLGIPAIRMNTGSWAGKRADDYYQTGISEPLPGYTDKDAVNWVIDGMGESLKFAEREGVILCIENHWGLSSNLDLLMKIFDALKSSPSMGLNVDTGNYVGDLYPQFRRLIKHADIIQAKTYYGGGNYYDLDIDYDRIAKIMREENFTGYVSLEMEGNEDPETAVPKSYERLRKAFAV